MPSPTEITIAHLSRLIGLPGAPVLVDVRPDDEFKSDPRLIPAAQRHASTGVEAWRQRYVGQPIIVVCRSGGTLSHAFSARLRHESFEAQTLEEGYDAWRELRQPLVRRGANSVGDSSETKGCPRRLSLAYVDSSIPAPRSCSCHRPKLRVYQST